MNYHPIPDNLYQEGTPITAKVNPDLKLVIMKYYQRIYYCAVVGEPNRKQFAYFERELVPLIKEVQPLNFKRVTKKFEVGRTY